ncbi:hypothetical protein RUM43_002378 [Polyplax serrata]|uniref:Uncharacterized protein n=1 Tax=Polyplax serrata TaxID=468196 RepID=A0AAN8PZG9_POLSC
MEIKRSDDTVTINQEKFIDKILNKFESSKEKKTPMEVQKDETKDINVNCPHREIIGSLVYLATEPDRTSCSSDLMQTGQATTEVGKMRLGEGIVRDLGIRSDVKPGNQGAIDLRRNFERNSKRSKHTDVKAHIIKDLHTAFQERGVLESVKMDVAILSVDVNDVSAKAKKFELVKAHRMSSRETNSKV